MNSGENANFWCASGLVGIGALWTVVTVVTLATLAPAVGFAREVCHELNRDFIRAAQALPKDSPQTIEAAVKEAVHLAPLHLIGEAHGFTDLRLIERTLTAFTRELRTQYQTQDICFFRELSPEGLSNIEAAYTLELQKPKKRQSSAQLRRLKYQIEIGRIAQRLGLTEQFINLPNTRSESFDGLRAIHIVNEIERLMPLNPMVRQTGVQQQSLTHLPERCQVGLMLTGKARISPIRFEIPSTSGSLRERGYHLVTYQLSDRLFEKDGQFESAVSPSCRVQLGSLPKVLRARDLRVIYPLYPRLSTERTLLWNDYDYSLLR